MFKKLSCSLLVLCVSQSSIARPLSEQAGWDSTLSLNALYISGHSQLSTSSENRTTNSLTNSGKSTSETLVIPLNKIFYTFDSLKTQLYFDANNADQITTNGFQYEFGMKHQFYDDSKLTFAVFPKLSVYNEVWEDPFLVGSDREETKQKVGGGRIAIEQIFASPFTVKYAIASSSIEDELSGQTNSLTSDEITLLNRDSIYQRFSIETMFPIQKRIFLKPTLEKNQRDADGAANSYEDYALKLGVLIFRERSFWATTLSMGVQNYEATNPIFDKKQDLVYGSLSSIFSYKEPLNLRNWNWNLLGAYTQKKSDISFYDSRSIFISTGMSYQF
ncbi:DUF2860 family protein [Psychromonas algicola]|uniref:DUF2860 family protein n=1 Tax=Psychromonas algicola TaxID=2555642 RepID=UPI0010686D96|nr:DUF2860 family protein [Psychromonas sp. RZ5]TEW52633.1 DUF2860 domain-containing protein [Psychromonas sp. RZ5]